MAYGMVVTNTNNQTVINDTEAQYTRLRSGTLSNSGTTNLGFYKFSISGNALTTSEEIVMYTCGVGSFIAFNLEGSIALGEITSNQSSLGYTVFGPRTSLSNPTGYGVAVYNSGGQCVWDAGSTLFRVSNAGRLRGVDTDYVGYSSGSITGGNAITATSGSMVVDFDQGFYQIAARRTGTSSWVFEQKRLHSLSGSMGGRAVFRTDFSYLLGTV